MSFIPGPRTFAAYLYKIRVYIGIIAALWVFATLIGVLLAVAMPEESNSFVELIAGQMKGMLSDNQFLLMLNIFFNNARACVLEVLLGLALGLMPLLIVFVNGLAMGLVITTSLAETGPVMMVAALLPHGIIEIPVVAISAAIGLRFGHCVLMVILKDTVDMKKELFEGLSVFIVWMLPLLFAAAFVESYVTVALLLYLKG